MAASLLAKVLAKKSPQPEISWGESCPKHPAPSFIKVLRVARLWDSSSLSLSGSFALRNNSISFVCFSRIFSWADLEMVTWICARSRQSPLPLGTQLCFLYFHSFSGSDM